MERLYPLIIVSAFFVLNRATAGEYCSLAVRVVAPDNQRLVEVPVSVREKGGRIVEKETAEEDLEFCDLGILPVIVKVGNHPCNQVVVQDVPIEWNERYLLTVTFDPQACVKERLASVPLCQVLFRISDVVGTWINGAVIQFDASRFQPRETDHAGRSLVEIQAGSKIGGTVSFRGYADKPFSVSCSRLERQKELSIQMERQ